MTLQFGLADVMNILIFFSLCISSYVVFYFSEKSNPNKKVTLSVFVLSFGITMIGLSHLFRIGVETTVQSFVLLSALIGALSTFIGFIMVFYQKSLEIITLKRRYEEVNAIIANLKDKYYKQEISEDDLRFVHSGLIKELAELEVKMKEETKTSKKHK